MAEPTPEKFISDKAAYRLAIEKRKEEEAKVNMLPSDLLPAGAARNTPGAFGALPHRPDKRKPVGARQPNKCASGLAAPTSWCWFSCHLNDVAACRSTPLLSHLL